jgi:hypothetical protein
MLRMRRMKTLLWGVLLSVSALPLGCSEDDDDGDPANSDHASGGKATNTTGGTGGKMDSEPANAGEGGTAASASDPAADARLERCETICATEADLPCAMETAECLMGWCVDPRIFPPGCLDAYDAMLACMAGEPIGSFECQGDMAFPKEEICGGEQATLGACLAG